MFKNISKKLRKGALALPLIAGLAPTLKAQDNDKPRGYFEAAGEYAQFFGGTYLEQVYGNAFGGSVGGAVRVKGPFHVGGRLSFLVGSGDYEKERSFASQKLNSQTLTIVGLEPYIELAGKNIFARVGYGNYSVKDQIREQGRSFFSEYDYPDTYKDNILGMFCGAGVKIPLTAVNSDKDGSIIIELNSRNASPLKTLSARIGADFNW